MTRRCSCWWTEEPSWTFETSTATLLCSSAAPAASLRGLGSSCRWLTVSVDTFSFYFCFCVQLVVAVDHFYVALFSALKQTHYALMWVYASDQLFVAHFWPSTQVVYLQRWRGWCHVKLLPSNRVLCTPCNHALWLCSVYPVQPRAVVVFCVARATTRRGCVLCSPCNHAPWLCSVYPVQPRAVVVFCVPCATTHRGCVLCTPYNHAPWVCCRCSRWMM